MNFSGWVMGVTAAIAVTALADIILADGNTKKFVKSITALIVFAVMISPIPALFGGSFEPAALIEEYQNEDYMIETALARAGFRAENLKKRLETVGVSGAEVTIHLGGFSVSDDIAAVVIDLSAAEGAVLSDAEIKAIAGAYVGVEANTVYITGRIDGKDQGTD